MAKFQMAPVILDGDVDTARLGSASGSANFFTDTEVGKCVKLAGDSRYNLTVAGDPIEGFVSSVNVSPLDDFSIGGVQKRGKVLVQLDGLQATPGTGTIAIGDYVVTGSVTAKGTVLPGLVKVCKATDQPGTAVVLADNIVATINAGLVKQAAAEKNALFAWRVVALITTGAVGNSAVIHRVSA